MEISPLILEYIDLQKLGLLDPVKEYILGGADSLVGMLPPVLVPTKI